MFTVKKIYKKHIFQGFGVIDENMQVTRTDGLANLFSLKWVAQKEADFMNKKEK